MWPTLALLGEDLLFDAHSYMISAAPLPQARRREAALAERERKGGLHSALSGVVNELNMKRQSETHLTFVLIVFSLHSECVDVLCKCHNDPTGVVVINSHTHTLCLALLQILQYI